VITRINAVLAGLLALILILLAIVGLGGNRVLPWTTAAEEKVDVYADIQAAATRVVLAFLDVDYRRMDDKADRIAALTTGRAHEQYAASAARLKATARRAKAVATGDIRSVGVARLAGRTAKALVAADVVVKNASTKGRSATRECPHDGARCERYRFVVTMTRSGGAWKMSDLAGVP
jgi:hypothetical protein